MENPGTWLERAWNWLRRFWLRSTWLATPRNWRALWWTIAEFVEIAWCCRGSLIPVVIGGGLIALADQARDIVIAEFNVKNPYSFLFAVTAWATSAWYWARTTLSFTFVLPPVGEGNEPRLAEFTPQQLEWCVKVREAFRNHIPRLIGAGAIAAVAVAFYKAFAVHYEAGDDAIAGFRWPFIACLVLAFVFYAVTWARVPLSNRWFGRARHLQASRQSHDRVIDIRNPLTRGFLTISFVCAPALTIWFSIDPVAASQCFGGAVNAVLIGFAVMIPVISSLAIASARFKLPVLGGVAVWMILSAAFVSDNHDVRLISAKSTVSSVAFADQRPHISEVFDRWYAVQSTIPGSAEAQPAALATPPLIVVATAGGASRAAYWTSQVLGTLADNEPGFVDRVFAISGVSGGSLGAVLFRSIVEVDRRRELAKSPPLGSIAYLAREFMTHDFLGPALATGLYVDLVRHAIPLGMRQDRAAALELAWESSWKANLDEAVRKTGAAGSANTLVTWDRGFLEAFGGADERHRPWPILLLNGSSVERGKRIVTSNVRFQGKSHLAPLRDGLAGATTRYDTFEILKADIPISTAASMSARFPVVSPSGGLRDSQGKVQGRITDGGLFENFGATTADEVLRHIIERRTDFQSADSFVAPVVILISSDPSLDQLERLTGTSSAPPDCPDRSGLIDADKNDLPPPAGPRKLIDRRPKPEIHPGSQQRECRGEPDGAALVLADPLSSLYTGRVARGEVAAVALQERIIENESILLQRAARRIEVAATKAIDAATARNASKEEIREIEDKAAKDKATLRRRLNYGNHTDVFHFRQCRLPNRVGPTMSWHDSQRAWGALDQMLGLKQDDAGNYRDPCGNAAEFFRLCMRLQTLTAAARDAEAASVECAKRWPKPAAWRCDRVTDRCWLDARMPTVGHAPTAPRR